MPSPLNDETGTSLRPPRHPRLPTEVRRAGRARGHFANVTVRADSIDGTGFAAEREFAPRRTGNEAGSFIAGGRSLTVLRFAVGSFAAVGGVFGICVFALLHPIAVRGGLIDRFRWCIARRPLDRTGLTVAEPTVGDRRADLSWILEVVPVRPDSGRAHEKERGGQPHSKYFATPVSLGVLTAGHTLSKTSRSARASRHDLVRVTLSPPK